MAERSPMTSILPFVLGFVLGSLFGGVLAAGVFATFGGDPEPEIAAIERPVVVPEARIEAAPVAAEPEPEPEPAAAAVEADAKPTLKRIDPSKLTKRKVAPTMRPDRVRGAGPTEVVFVAADGSRYTPEGVPAGKYKVHANFGDGLKEVGKATVKEGKPLKLVCDPVAQTCSAK